MSTMHSSFLEHPYN